MSTLTSQSQSHSAAPFLALLDESDAGLKLHALQRLNEGVVSFWAETGDKLSEIEIIFEDSTLPLQTRELAALLLSKVYFHLGAEGEALSFALNAGDAFEKERTSAGASVEYVSSVISQCIDTYISNQSSRLPTDPRLQSVIDSLFSSSMAAEQWMTVLGIALDGRRFDIIQQVFEATGDAAVLRYVMNSVLGSVNMSQSARVEVLRFLLPLFSHGVLQVPDYPSLLQLYVHLNTPTACAQMLSQLLREGKHLIAFQLAFDLVSCASQSFLDQTSKSCSASSNDVDQKLPAEADVAMESTESSVLITQPADSAKKQQLIQILSGETSIKLFLEFLGRNNKTDMLILKGTVEALEGRTSLYHSAVTFAHTFMSAGTSNDAWLRLNLAFLGKATNWSKFTATSSLGVVNKGNLVQGRSIIQPYLPKPGNPGSGSFYSEGGALYALGLIYANHGKDVVPYLEEQLRQPGANEVIQHGAALGLGVAGMATYSEESYGVLRDALFNDQAVAGEACAYGMGLVMLGSADEKCLDEMLQYAHETQHEKIVRGLAMGVAFVMYGKGPEADATIDSLLAEKDPILRYGGVYTLAMAYAGTGSNLAVKKLLQVAVSDVNDDVRRSAVTCLGFILFKTPSQVPRLVQLLSESYNPAVRYGACLALGISCAGTALKEAVDILEPLMKDPIDYVRQGAFISLALVLIQANEGKCSRMPAIRAHWVKVIADKHEDPMAKFGAAVAQGIIDAGGRNATIMLSAKGGSTNMSAVIGLALFAQIWYWFPLAHCLSLAFTPTAIVAVTEDMKVPKISFTSNEKPSVHAYVPPTKVHVEEKAEKVTTAVLSTTVKATARQKEKEKEKERDGGDVDMADSIVLENPEKTEPEEATPPAEKEEPAEPSFETITNCSRVLPAQVGCITFDCSAGARFVPVWNQLNSKSSILQGAPKREKTKRSGATNLNGSGFGLGVLVLADNGGDADYEVVYEPEKKDAQGKEGQREAIKELQMPDEFEYEFK